MRRRSKRSSRVVVEQLESRMLADSVLAHAAMTAMAVDAQGVVHVAYYDSDDARLKYTTRGSDDVWSTPRAIDGRAGVGTQISIALDANGRPAIAYYDNKNADLRLAREGTTGWSTVTVDSKGNVGQNPSLAFQGNNPVISYYAVSTKDLRVATLAKKNKWQVKTVDAAGTVGRYSSIAINPLGGTWGVAYESTDKRQVRLYDPKHGKSTIATLAKANAWTADPNLFYDAVGRPVVTYSDTRNDAFVLSQAAVKGKRWTFTSSTVTAGNGGAAARALGATFTNGLRLVFATPDGTVDAATRDTDGWTLQTLQSDTLVATVTQDGNVVVVSSAGDDVSLPDSAGPSDLAITWNPDAAGVRLNWADNSDRETVYRIDRSTDGINWTTLATLAADTTSYTDTTAAAGMTYSYRVVLVRGAATGGSAAQASITLPLAPPANLGITLVGGILNLSWSAVDGSTGFRVERSTDGGTWVTAAVLSTGDTHFADPSARLGHTYAYRVVALGINTESAPSNQVALNRSIDAPAAPAVTITNSGIGLTWSDVIGETGYRVERSADNGAWLPVASLAADATNYADSSVLAGHNYRYRVVAVGPNSESVPSAQASATLILPAPTGVSVSFVPNSGVNLSWSPVAASTGYRIQRSTDAANWATVATVTAGLTGFLDTTAAPGRSYAYRLVAIGASADSSPTSPILLSIPMDAPVGLAVNPVTAGQSGSAEEPGIDPGQATVNLAWSDVAGAIGFRVERSVDGGAWAALTTRPAGTTSYIDTDVLPGHGYGYRIVAVGASLESAASTQATVTVPLDTPTDLGVSFANNTVHLIWSGVPAATGYRVERSVDGGAWVARGTVAPAATLFDDPAPPADHQYAFRVVALGFAAESAPSGQGGVDVPLAAPASVGVSVVAAKMHLVWSAVPGAAGFRIDKSTDGGVWQSLGTTAAATVTLDDSDVTVGHQYQYRVTTLGVVLESAPSTPTTAPALEAPQSPTSFAAQAVSDTEVNLTWERVGNGESSVTVWRSADGGASFQRLATLPAGSNIFTDTSCYPSTPYTYRVTADNAAGSSPPSASVAATTTASQATLATVAGALAASPSGPFAVHLSWSDPATGYRNWLVERSADGGTSYTLVNVVPGTSTSATYDDANLAPGTAYTYRVRMATGGGYGDYTAPVAATTAARPAGGPLEPVDLSAVVNSATGVALSWSDRSGGAASYQVQTAPYSWTGTPAWTTVATTPAGATGYTLTTTAETFYYVRVRAVLGGVASDYTLAVAVRTASAGTAGGPKVYEVGPGKQYASLAALDWTKLGPGDTVRIYPNRDANGTVVPYYEKPLVSVRGTAAAPVTITGVPDPVTGQLPVIDGTNAVTAPQWASHYRPLEDFGLILVGTRPGQSSSGWSPGYLTISNLEIRNAYTGDPGTPAQTYTADDGTTRAYSESSGIYLEDGDHITIKGNAIHDNNQGVFGAGQGDQRNLEQVTLESNRIYGNGTVNGSRQHQTYLEGIGTVYQFNDYGPLRAGSLGGGLKDRGAGTVIRYNSVAGGGHLLDLVEAQNYLTTTLSRPDYRMTFVYGNVLLNAGAATAASTPIHYGGDGGVTATYRKGTLYFYDNTFVNTLDQAQRYRVNVFQMQSTGESLDARGNVIYFRPATPGAAVSEIDLLSTAGVGYFGRNWVNAGWQTSQVGATFTGHLAGAGNLLTGANPGLIDPASGNYRPAANSPLVDQATDVLPANVLAVIFEFDKDKPGRWQDRILSGTRSDLGAFEAP